MSGDTSGPAFPFREGDITHEGMSLRDYFAASALISLGAAAATRTEAPAVVVARMAGIAYEIADKMLLARNL